MLTRRTPELSLRRQIQSTRRAVLPWLTLKNQYSRGAEGWGFNTRRAQLLYDWVEHPPDGLVKGCPASQGLSRATFNLRLGWGCSIELSCRPRTGGAWILHQELLG